PPLEALAVVGFDFELFTAEIFEMGGDRLGTLAAAGNLDHHFRDMPDRARDLLDLSGQHGVAVRRNSAPMAHDVQERTVASHPKGATCHRRNSSSKDWCGCMSERD